MAVNVCLPLFGDPGRELEEGAKGQHLRELGEQLRDRLARTADVLDALHGAGWSSQVVSFDVLLTHPNASTRRDAERLLAEAGVNPNEFMIVEDVDDDESN
jgi:hypothetical protein